MKRTLKTVAGFGGVHRRINDAILLQKDPVRTSPSKGGFAVKERKTACISSIFLTISVMCAHIAHYVHALRVCVFGVRCFWGLMNMNLRACRV